MTRVPVLLLTLLLLLPAAARAAEVGSSLALAPTGTPGACPGGSGGRCVDVLERVGGGTDVVTPAGVVTAWRLRAPAQPDVQVRLRITRTGTASLDLASAPVTVRGGAVEAFATRLPVAEGDRIALDAPRQLGATAPAPGARHTVGARARAGEELLLQATVEPDDDHDGFGDLTQDGCPEDAARQACRADLAVTAPEGEPVAATGTAAALFFIVHNAGPDRAEGVQVTASGSRVLSVAGCTAGTCPLPPLTAGASREVELQVTADEQGTIPVTLRATTAAADPTPAVPAQAAGTARFVPQSVEPPRTTLPAPACASVRGGTREDDVLEGTAFGDTLRGLEGRDLLRGGGAGDCLEGGASGDVLAGGTGGDRLLGGTGADRLYGDDGNDALKGGLGNDVLFGGPGADQLYGAQGADRLQGGAGDDLLNARDGVRERVDCGPGSDRAQVDRRDRTRGCERVERR